ncbi:aminotransferase [Synergistales bacterium]|nr:aminotransferase [Synergistales bacterium]
MKIAPFGVEQWMNEWETGAVTNLAETCVKSLTVEELLELSGRGDAVLKELLKLRMSYGDIPGSDELLERVAALYERQKRENVIMMNGGSGANFLSLYTLVEPGDEVVSVNPTYQQLYSIPESFGAKVKLLHLKIEDGFLPDLGRLAELVTSKTRVICVNNPNNPTGSLMEEPLLRGIADIARQAGAWLYCDEVYRFMVHDPSKKIPSVADIYEKGVVSCSFSKCFSLAGLRLGWIAGPKPFIEDVFSRRDYMTVSCGRIDDLLGRTALAAGEKILSRNLAIVRECAEVLDRWIESEKRVSYVKPSAGTTAFPRYDYNIPSEEFCARLFRKDGTFLLPGKCFGEEFDRHLRVGYAYSPALLEEGLKKVSAFLRDLESEGL